MERPWQMRGPRTGYWPSKETQCIPSSAANLGRRSAIPGAIDHATFEFASARHERCLGTSRMERCSRLVLGENLIRHAPYACQSSESTRASHVRRRALLRSPGFIVLEVSEATQVPNLLSAWLPTASSAAVLSGVCAPTSPVLSLFLSTLCDSHVLLFKSLLSAASRRLLSPSSRKCASVAPGKYGWNFFSMALRRLPIRPLTRLSVSRSCFKADREHIATAGDRTGIRPRSACTNCCKQTLTLTATVAAKKSGLTMPTVNSALAELRSCPLVREITGRKRGRVFSYKAFNRHPWRGGIAPTPTNRASARHRNQPDI